ncbi:SLC35F2 [Branchiostoma lanceolatum]|uniref:SLC35F2 protein n=1 Tax=Branchiostoma lanceolatum TaxID=7740 RepID=A0A8K0EMV7_BRALA|nr:SLC35F2 [Branchiostoma lanceolatum]
MAAVEERREEDVPVENIGPVAKVQLTWRDRLRRRSSRWCCWASPSVLICGTSVTSTLLEAKYKVSTPTAQSFLNYILLALVFSIPLAFAPHPTPPPARPMCTQRTVTASRLSRWAQISDKGSVAAGTLPPPSTAQYRLSPDNQSGASANVP